MPGWRQPLPAGLQLSSPGSSIYPIAVVSRSLRSVVGSCTGQRRKTRLLASLAGTSCEAQPADTSGIFRNGGLHTSSLSGSLFSSRNPHQGSGPNWVSSAPRQHLQVVSDSFFTQDVNLSRPSRSLSLAQALAAATLLQRTGAGPQGSNETSIAPDLWPRSPIGATAAAGSTSWLTIP